MERSPDQAEPGSDDNDDKKRVELGSSSPKACEVPQGGSECASTTKLKKVEQVHQMDKREKFFEDLRDRFGPRKKRLSKNLLSLEDVADVIFRSEKEKDREKSEVELVLMHVEGELFAFRRTLDNLSRDIADILSTEEVERFIVARATMLQQNVMLDSIRLRFQLLERDIERLINMEKQKGEKK